MQKSIATVSLSGTLPEKLEAAAAVGFDGVEIFENDLLTFDGSPEEVRTIAGNLGLAITLFQPFRDFEAMPEPRRAQNLGRAERKFDVMQALGTDLVLVCSNTHAATANDDSRAAADLAAMAERAERREFRAAPARLRDGLRSLLWLEAEAGAASLPPPPVFDGIEFIEFAVDDDAARRLGEQLRSLGLRHAGHHRSKAVELFRHGRVNFVLNSELDSAASEHFQLHGPSVCAMALRVDDAARAVQRANVLLCPEWQERIGEGERTIPALRAPDGTLLYLVQPDPSGRSIYEDDFRLFADQTDDEMMLTNIDHVAQALPVGRLDNFVLFWRTLFGFVPEQLWEIADPYGLVRSQTMASMDHTVRLPLNVSESRQTGTGRFLTTYAGAGAQHVALASDDIVATLRRLEARGSHSLPIPANYYEDVAAKWDLDEDRLETLRSLKLLYDRDDTGEFLHAYTAAFDDRFFFEIVQRIGNYQQYGAANATVRMAAQAQQHVSSRLTGLLD